jgi:L-rhamnose mutarotase
VPTRLTSAGRHRKGCQAGGSRWRWSSWPRCDDGQVSATDANPNASEAAEPSARRIAAVVHLRPEHEVEYRRLHADVWPGVLATLRRVGVRNYSIFLRDGLLFSYLEYTGEDWAAAQAEIAEDPETQRWWQLTDPMQQPLKTAAEGEWWAPAEEVFHVD